MRVRVRFGVRVRVGVRAGVRVRVVVTVSFAERPATAPLVVQREGRRAATCSG